ncbi:MAG: U32 family peptidase [Paludibacteraceae bacterium]|nr:U32 family peptidase [Paludibacteraceae bacterium]
MELLAPAKNIEVARAAIMAGADAVYIGAPRFGARQAAGNSIDDLHRLATYAHRFGVKVLVTVNTLMDDTERREAAAMAWQLYEAEVDALIVQDLRLLREQLPPIRLHASTQCDNRTAEQVLRLQRMGFRRAVLARELSLDAIRAIRQATIADQPDEPIELEVFVHGAVCVCYSGRCYMSERLLGRSANRGACAQMCRMGYDVLDSRCRELRDADGKPMHQRYVLSLKDMNRSAYLQDLQDAGVTTLKIEGRLKDADYVTNVVAYYREKLDALTNAKNGNNNTKYAELVFKRTFEPDPAKTFHRGDSPYFIAGRTAGLANWDSPKSTGEQIGIVTSARDRSMHVQLLPGVTLHNGDGLCYSDRGFQANSVTPLSGSAVAISTFKAVNIPVGTMLYRNTDTAFIRQLHAERHIPVSIRLEAEAEGFALTISSYPVGSWSVTRHYVHSHTAATQGEQARTTQANQLAKLGDTDYVAVEVSVPDKAYFIPISTLNAWRREVAAAAVLAQDASFSRQEVAPIIADEQQMPDYNSDNQPLMTCRYCILHEMGHCRKQPARLTPADEPKYLRLSNGTLLTVQFDCKQCEMIIDHANKQ